ncbi:hypothetical protein SAMN05661091_1752 [Paenibacillus uliginis N3/975]|uniref:Uncharacterized protein n=1 Tax=Paenibacillus uliginis N3/975 TaxID=1313296 RepID=A0A1X7H4J9_9BACL|nr:hypothetical protein [Paenibacillus uliginis]SMF79666.1 hypothetical protein SAMN05661091_1752 [Paenibacillus uliginis N3/975]
MFKILVSDPISDFGLQQLTNAEDVEVTKLSGLCSRGRFWLRIDLKISVLTNADKEQKEGRTWAI